MKNEGCTIGQLNGYIIEQTIKRTNTTKTTNKQADKQTGIKKRDIIVVRHIGLANETISKRSLSRRKKRGPRREQRRGGKENKTYQTNQQARTEYLLSHTLSLLIVRLHI